MTPRSSAGRRTDAERYLLSLELFGMRFGLDRMRRLLTALGSPQERFASIHVVGTNGKSSTARMTAAILERHGLRTGAYLSPHLVSFAERIRVGERDVAGERLRRAPSARGAAAADAARPHAAEPDDHVTQFEAAHRGRVPRAGATRASRWRWSRPGWAGATTPPTCIAVHACRS